VKVVLQSVHGVRGITTGIAAGHGAMTARALPPAIPDIANDHARIARQPSFTVGGTR
jgi:hypothetical protein